MHVATQQRYTWYSSLLATYNAEVEKYNTSETRKKYKPSLNIGGRQTIILTMTAVGYLALGNIIMSWIYPFADEKFVNFMLIMSVYPFPQILLAFLLSYMWNRSLYLAGETPEQHQKLKKKYFYPLVFLALEMVISTFLRNVVAPVLSEDAQRYLHQPAFTMARLYWHSFEVVCALIMYCYHVYIVCRDLRVSFSKEYDAVKEKSSFISRSFNTTGAMGSIKAPTFRDAVTRKLTPSRGVAVSPMSAGDGTTTDSPIGGAIRNKTVFISFVFAQVAEKVFFHYNPNNSGNEERSPGPNRYSSRRVRDNYETGERRRGLFTRMMVSTIACAFCYICSIVCVAAAHYNGVMYTADKDFEVRLHQGVTSQGQASLPFIEMLISANAFMFMSVLTTFASPKFRNVMKEKEKRWDAIIARTRMQNERALRREAEGGDYDEDMKVDANENVNKDEGKDFRLGIRYFKNNQTPSPTASLQDGLGRSSKVRQRAKTQDYHRW